jgi:hypothetical protein
MVRQQTERQATAQAQLVQAQLVRGGRLNGSAGRVVVRASRPPGVPAGPSKFKVHGKVDPKTLAMRPLGTSNSSTSAAEGLRSFAYVPSAEENGDGGGGGNTSATTMEVDEGGGEEGGLSAT